MEESYPRAISKGFPGIPNALDAILPIKGGFLAFQGPLYWFYDLSKPIPVDVHYPRQVTDFVGLPSHVDAAVMTTEGRRLLFSGMKYYELDHSSQFVRREGDVRKDLFGC